MKSNYIFKKHLVKRVTLFDIFQILNVWLNRRHLGSHTYCFCIQSVVISCVKEPLGNSTIHTQNEGKRQMMP